MTDAAETDRLVNTDLSTLTPAELKAHLADVERQMLDILRTERALLEANAEVLADHPALQARLTHLRTVSGSPADEMTNAADAAPRSGQADS
jgi:hypothetical protein